MSEWDGDQEPRLYFIDVPADHVEAHSPAPPSLTVRRVLNRCRVSSMDYWALRSFVKFKLGLSILDIGTVKVKPKPQQ